MVGLNSTELDEQPIKYQNNRQQTVSYTHLDVYKRQVLGVRPLDYIINKRLERAKLLITTSSLSLQEIADRVGVFDIYYFSKLFKSRFGIAPSQYRKQVSELD